MSDGMKFTIFLIIFIQVSTFLITNFHIDSVRDEIIKQATPAPAASKPEAAAKGEK